jgi:hypothetical protein
MRRGFILWWGATNGRRHVTVQQSESIISINRSLLTSEARFVQGSKKPIAAPVAGEDAPGSIAAMRGRRQSQYQQSGSRIAKTWNRFAPIPLICKPSHLFSSDPLTPLD